MKIFGKPKLSQETEEIHLANAKLDMLARRPFCPFEDGIFVSNDGAAQDGRLPSY